ncbi:hypothetical protein [Enterocloster citroniae]|nr:hypothetical protein [Enterocloster citroniae]
MGLNKGLAKTAQAIFLNGIIAWAVFDTSYMDTLIGQGYKY